MICYGHKSLHFVSTNMNTLCHKALVSISQASERSMKTGLYTVTPPTIAPKLTSGVYLTNLQAIYREAYFLSVLRCEELEIPN